jgi:hypothetical protein
LKVSVAEIDEMRRRGMPADAVRVREPLVKKMREQRLKVIYSIITFQSSQIMICNAHQIVYDP